MEGETGVEGFCVPGGGSSHLTVIDCSVELLLPQLPMPPSAELVQYGANVGGLKRRFAYDVCRAEGGLRGMYPRKMIFSMGRVV